MAKDERTDTKGERKAGRMVHYMDAIVGRLLSKLKELGIL